MTVSFETLARIHRGWELILSGSLDSLACGHYETGDEGIFVNVMEYETKTEGSFEAHRKYIDIQYILSGEEKIGVAPTDSLRVTQEYDEASDVLFGEGEGREYILRAHQAIVLLPSEAHMPSLCVTEPSHVKKAVVKVPV